MSNGRLDLQRIKVVALAVDDLRRVRQFYVETLGLPQALEGSQPVGCLLADGDILMFKTDWYGRPTDTPNPRITLEVSDAHATEVDLRQRGVRISNPVTRCDDALVGAFLDSEGNKLWFCSKV